MEDWLKENGLKFVVGWWYNMPPTFATYIEEDGSWTICNMSMEVIASHLPEDQAKESIERLLNS